MQTTHFTRGHHEEPTAEGRAPLRRLAPLLAGGCPGWEMAPDSSYHREGSGSSGPESHVGAGDTGSRAPLPLPGKDGHGDVPAWGCSGTPLGAPAARAGPDQVAIYHAFLLHETERQPPRWKPLRPWPWDWEEGRGAGGLAPTRQSCRDQSHTEKLHLMPQLSKA